MRTRGGWLFLEVKRDSRGRRIEKEKSKNKSKNREEEKSSWKVYVIGLKLLLHGGESGQGEREMRRTIGGGEVIRAGLERDGEGIGFGALEIIISIVHGTEFERHNDQL